MNLVMLDGTINSPIERVPGLLTERARFTVSTTAGDGVGVRVEVRGNGAERLYRNWKQGDVVHVRGRITSFGYVAADAIKRLGAGNESASSAEGENA